MMSAPKKNKFWQLRSKHGRNRLFETPAELWEQACEYFEWIDNNPLYETKAFNTKNDGIVLIEIPKQRPYTLSGLCVYIECNKNYLDDLEKSKDGKDFSDIITHIREIIYTQKFEGACTGLFNANIISKELGLSSKKDVALNSVLCGLDAVGYDSVEYI